MVTFIFKYSVSATQIQFINHKQILQIQNKQTNNLQNIQNNDNSNSWIWKSKTLIQPILQLLEYLKIDYEDKNYDRAGEEWFNHDKQQLIANFPNLPYLLDGQNIITESAVIPVYIIKKHNKYELLRQNSDGSFNEKEMKVLQVIEVITDIRSQIQQEIIKVTFKENKDKIYAENYSVYIEKLKRQVGDQQFVFGNVTYADFLLYETLKSFNYVYPKISTMNDYQQRFENIEQIKEYLSSNTFVQNFIPQSYLSFFNFQDQ